MTNSESPEPSSVVSQKLAAQLSRQLEDEISSRRWPIGAVLGSEIELQQRFGVSRSILREAVRLLEHCRVARMRPGPGGGLVVCEPDASTATRSLVIYLEYMGVTVEQLVDARLILEPLAGRLTAETMTEAGIELLRKTVRAEYDATDDPNFLSHESFHVRLASLSGNPLLKLLTDVSTTLTGRYLQTSPCATATSSARAHLTDAVSHADITDAVVAGDGAAAHTRLVAHLEVVKARMLAEHIHQSSVHMRNRPVDPDPQPMLKRFEVVAGQIHADITMGDWRVGDILGSESDLMVRYGVGRAVLREALHILEHHSVARMRRGPGGGLVILAPDPTASFRTIALYLDYHRSGAAHRHVVRQAIELGCIRIITAGRIAPEATDRLRTALDHDATQNDSGERFHTALAAVAGNPILTLFIDIIDVLAAYDDRRERTQTTRCPHHLRENHENILSAIVDGDEALAQHRMRKHWADLANF